MLVKRHSPGDKQALKITAAILSWGLYGASVKWRMDSELQPEEYIKLVIPYILKGTDLESKSE